MRVLIDYRAALRARSGVGEYTHQLVRALASPDAQAAPDAPAVAIFSSSWRDRLVGPHLAELGAVERFDRRVPVRVLNRLWHRWGWPPVETLLGTTFDVVHSQNPLLMPSRSAAQVLTIHDLDFLVHPERTRAEIRRDYPALVRSHAARAHQIVVPSRYTAGNVQRLLAVDPARVSVCPPGAPDWQRRAAPPGPPGEAGYILFVGTLEARKNVKGLLEAYAILCGRRPGVPRLVLAGTATPESASLLQTLKEAPLAGRSTYLGYVEPEDRQRVYEGAALLVLPSFDEGFGLPVLEAMSLGVPVAASTGGALPEVVGDAGELFDPTDAGAMAAAIERVVTNPDRGADLARRGIERARGFTWRRTATTMVDAYRAALAARDGRRRDRPPR